MVSHSNTPGTSLEPPAAPQNLTAVVTSGSIALSWDKPSGPVTRWERSEKIGSGSFDSWTEVMVTESGTAPDIKLNWTNTSLADGVAYAVEIRGVNDAGNGAVGSIGPVVPGMPNPPATLAVGEAAVEADRQTTLKLTWTAGQVITGVIVAGYQYGYRASGATSWGAWTNIPGDGTTTMTEVADLSPGTTYEFQVRAMARNIPSDPSDSATGTTADPPAPAKPELVSATASIGGVVLAWKPLNDNTITVYRSRHTTTLTNDDPDFSEASWVACSNEASAMSCLVANDLLTIGTEHFFQIQAENPGGTSESYNSVSASPIPGSVPSVTLTSEQGSFSPVVDWEDVPGASLNYS